MQGSSGFFAVATGLLGVALLSVAPAAHAQRRADTTRCESNDGHYQRCPVRWRDAKVVRQESKANCVRGQSWGVDRQGLWVDRGCRAVFAEAGRGGPGHGDHGGMPPGNGWNRQIRLQCSSNSRSYQMCQVDVGRNGRVSLVRRLSDARCVEGSSWGWNRAGVWVNRGCRAEFLIDRRR
jgi:hypothetical protein